MNFLKNKSAFFLLIFSFLGFLDSTYLTIMHYRNAFPPCTLLNGCEQVLTSIYSQVYGIPIALFGSLFYGSVMILATLLITHPARWISKFVVFMTACGILVSLFLLFIQIFVLKFYCQYCLFAESMALFMLIFAVLNFKNLHSAGKTGEQK